jgi:hypothetical protein
VPVGPLSQADLDRMTCSVPGCTHQNHDGLFLNQRCHPQGGVEAFYQPTTGLLRVTCFVCKVLICNVKVAATI